MDLDKGEKKRTIKRRISLFVHVRQENTVFLFLPVKDQEREDIDYRHCSSVIKNRNEELGQRISIKTKVLHWEKLEQR